MNKQYVDRIRYSKTGGIDVFTTCGKVYHNVSVNIVKCAFGSDFDYLLRTKGEATAFPLDPSEIRDFKKYKV